MLYILGRWSNPSFFNLNFSQNFSIIYIENKEREN